MKRSYKQCSDNSDATVSIGKEAGQFLESIRY